MQRGKDAASTLPEVFCGLSYCGKIGKVCSVISFFKVDDLQIDLPEFENVSRYFFSETIFRREARTARDTSLD